MFFQFSVRQFSQFPYRMRRIFPKVIGRCCGAVLCFSIVCRRWGRNGLVGHSSGTFFILGASGRLGFGWRLGLCAGTFFTMWRCGGSGVAWLGLCCNSCGGLSQSRQRPFKNDTPQCKLLSFQSPARCGLNHGTNFVTLSWEFVLAHSSHWGFVAGSRSHACGSVAVHSSHCGSVAGLGSHGWGSAAAESSGWAWGSAARLAAACSFSFL